jgi:hypothetical protein
MRPGGFEPPTHSLEGCCSIQLSYGRRACRSNRGAGIRTRDLLLPKQARYRTAPHPVNDRNKLNHNHVFPALYRPRVSVDWRGT